ncbi:Rab family GTPase [Lewinella cohaerens]|uniref:Rab family GTPase n=1 Tax=Lewinella cohaerens TaxID=70995 RepID=UPI00035CDBB7|nr:Rab family GTPase [Lewinella cohaerens]
MISKKVVITGHFGVGKTSLFNRFITNTFNEKYLTTIGVRVDKKSVIVNGEEISLIIWDLAGEVSQEKVPRSYFLGASAIIYVFDLSRPATFSRLEDDLVYINSVLPNVLIRKVGNKKDLVSDQTLKDIRAQTQPHFFTSARTGENVEELFEGIARKLLRPFSNPE